MVRGNGSARAGTSVKAIARPNTIRISTRPRPLHDTLDDDLSTITSSPFVTSLALALQRSVRLARDAQRNGHSRRGFTVREDSKCQTLTRRQGYRSHRAGSFRPACGYCISVEQRKRGWQPAGTPPGRLSWIRQLELSMLFTWPAALQCCRDASKQFIGITWLGEVADDTIGHCANPNALVRVCSDQNRWNDIARVDEMAVQLDSGHSRHVDVHDQARRIANVRACEEIERGRECLDREPHRGHQTLQSLARVLIIVDDGDQSFRRQMCLLHLVRESSTELYTNAVFAGVRPSTLGPRAIIPSDRSPAPCG